MNRKSDNKRSHAFAFSIVGSLLLISLCFFINYSTGSRFPWFIYPTFAVIWWPLGVFFAGRDSAKAFSLIGSLLIIAVLLATNYLTSWNYPWFIFPSFAVIWWPLGVFFGKRCGKALSIIGSLIIIGFSVVTNYITSPEYIWYIYPTFAIIWWPLSVFLSRPRTIKAYSIFGALIILAFLAVDNFFNSPTCLWVLFAVYPLLLWPTCVFLDERTLRLPTALILSAIGITYYVALNIIVFPGFPWAIFTAYVLLWWPLSVAFAGRGHHMLFSMVGTILSALLFIALNVITTPNTIWAVYPVFALAWWPLSIYYFKYKPCHIGDSKL
ncbi:MAG: hypothetical protein CVU91_11285 [Firmicutes bacterium HGW-Firmicutes-16]|nr:MAG: hypothetical protein CVU91_11285 [Firmicutes bacterium HGW-Firmicutes-16]